MKLANNKTFKWTKVPRRLLQNYLMVKGEKGKFEEILKLDEMFPRTLWLLRTRIHVTYWLYVSHSKSIQFETIRFGINRSPFNRKFNIRVLAVIRHHIFRGCFHLTLRRGHHSFYIGHWDLHLEIVTTEILKFQF